MKILRDPTRLTPCVLVLGMFDGVHRGHQALLMRGGELAQEMDFPLCVLSFEPHPLRVLAPHKAPPLLNTLPEKARSILPVPLPPLPKVKLKPQTTTTGA